MAGLGTGAQQAALQGAQAQIGAGTLQQQTEQAGKQALYNQFLQQQGYPFQVAQFLANIAYGAPYPTTTTTTQPVGFLGALSDRRAKKDIKRVGKTDDGMPIYKFKYKGDSSGLTHMGLMAQDVEKEKPEAVGLAGGYKTVDYDRATKFYGGGVGDSMGGAVLEPGAFADGGLADIIALQKAMYGGPGGSGATGLGAGGPYGANLAPIQRASAPSAGAIPRLPPSVLQELGQTADLGEKLDDAGARPRSRQSLVQFENLADLPLDRVQEFCRQFPEEEFYVSVHAAEDAVRRHSMFNLIHPRSGLKVDVIVPVPTVPLDVPSPTCSTPSLTVVPPLHLLFGFTRVTVPLPIFVISDALPKVAIDFSTTMLPLPPSACATASISSPPTSGSSSATISPPSPAPARSSALPWPRNSATYPARYG